MRWLVFSVMICGLGGTARAGDIWCAVFGHARRWPDCVQQVECDDYCRKPAPCSCAHFSLQCPDYRPKPLPCACGRFQFGCDDYCRKTWSWLFCPPARSGDCPCGGGRRCGDRGG